MVLSNHSMVFVYVSSPRSYFASRPYNYSLCLYCKFKEWIHRGKQHTNMIKSASVWIWVEGWLLKDSLSKSRWLRSWAIFDAHHLFFLLDTFLPISLSFHHLFQLSFFITYSPSLFFRLVRRMERDPRYMESLFCGKVERYVCGEVERNVCASSQCKSIA